MNSAKLYKYQGAGNDFLIADNRDGSLMLSVSQISALCDRRYGIGADGLMTLESSDRYGFRMEYYNSDGSGGMMCGNGGRCIVAFAADMGMTDFTFEAPDGLHTAKIISSEGQVKIISLKMKDVEQCRFYERLAGVGAPSDGYFLDTGTRHFVRFVDGIDEYDVITEGREIRHSAELEPVGANVNFVEACDGILKVRTYEKGVEDETFACGTGIVASCIAAYSAGVHPSVVSDDGVGYEVKAKRDSLSVAFKPLCGHSGVAGDVWLTGPAAFVAEISVIL